MVEACETEISAVCEILKSEMEQAVSMTVPLKADVGTGKNWYEAK
jgi:DNA polymerase-1